MKIYGVVSTAGATTLCTTCAVKAEILTPVATKAAWEASHKTIRSGYISLTNLDRKAYGNNFCNECGELIYTK